MPPKAAARKGNESADVNMDDEDFDVDNMDFELPADLVSTPATQFGKSSSGTAATAGKAGKAAKAGKARSSGGAGPGLEGSGAGMPMFPSFPGMEDMMSAMMGGAAGGNGRGNAAGGGGFPMSMFQDALGMGMGGMGMETRQGVNMAVSGDNNASGPMRMETLQAGTDTARWTVVYPLYIDATQPLALGRRIPKEKGVAHPNALIMGEALRRLGLPVVVEAKRHPATPLHIGRVRVQLKDAEGRPQHSTVRTKRQLLRFLVDNYADARKEVEALLDDDQRLRNLLRAFDYENLITPSALFAEFKKQASSGASSSAAEASAASSSSSSGVAASEAGVAGVSPPLSPAANKKKNSKNKKNKKKR